MRLGLQLEHAIDRRWDCSRLKISNAVLPKRLAAQCVILFLDEVVFFFFFLSRAKIHPSLRIRRIGWLGWVGNERLFEARVLCTVVQDRNFWVWGKLQVLRLDWAPQSSLCSLAQAVAGLDGGKVLVFGIKALGSEKCTGLV